MAPVLALLGLSLRGEELTPTEYSLSCPHSSPAPAGSSVRSAWPGLPKPEGLEPPAPGQDSGAQRHPPQPMSQITLAPRQTGSKQQVILVIPRAWLRSRVRPSFRPAGPGVVGALCALARTPCGAPRPLSPLDSVLLCPGLTLMSRHGKRPVFLPTPLSRVQVISGARSAQEENSATRQSWPALPHVHPGTIAQPVACCPSPVLR